MTNRDIYKDEFGNYHEVDDEVESPLDGFEDDEQDIDEDAYFGDDDEQEYEDEDETYANERRDEFDIDED